MPSIEEYQKYDPCVETIIKDSSIGLIVIDRYGPDDYGVWWTDPDHLYDETYGSSTRGSLKDILHELRDDII